MVESFRFRPPGDVSTDTVTNALFEDPIQRVQGTETQHHETTTLQTGVDLTNGSAFVRLYANTQAPVLFTDIVISAIRVNSLSVTRIGYPIPGTIPTVPGDTGATES